MISPSREGLKWWLAVIVPPLAWGARLLAGWTIAEVACDSGQAGAVGYTITQMAVALVALLAIAVSGLVALNALRSEEVGLTFDTTQAKGFLGVAGVLTALVFGLLVVVEASAVFVVGC